jgi:hypothetical protein
MINLVNGIKKTTNNKNGKERVILTNKFNVEKTDRFSSIWPFLQRKSNVPTGSPIRIAARIETPTMTKVSPIDCQISASY